MVGRIFRFIAEDIAIQLANALDIGSCRPAQHQPTAEIASVGRVAQFGLAYALSFLEGLTRSVDIPG